jgi:23S rRNA pseudouridine1911/1915/1917 synthase
VCSPKHKVNHTDIIEIEAKIEPALSDSAENIPLNIVFEDDHILIINKSAGLVSHPGAGNKTGTLVNALLHHDSTLSTLPRAGLIHRLDKDTSGLLIIAKDSQSFDHLTEAMKKRQIKRQYLALCQGRIISGGTIDKPIDRDSKNRVKMAVTDSGKPAVTHYRVKARYPAHTLLSIELETGRTHQIRVHLTHAGYPLVGDKTYRKQKALACRISPELQQACLHFPRQALHAEKLTLTHPINGKSVTFKAPVPNDLSSLIETMQHEVNLR